MYNVILCGTRWGMSYLLPLLQDHEDGVSRLYGQSGVEVQKQIEQYKMICEEMRIRHGIENTSRFKLAGILTKGSDRSKALCQRLGVQHYSSVEEIRGKIDLACVVVGEHSGGPTIVDDFLARDTHVLYEHPLSSSGIALIAEKDGNKSKFGVNTHFNSCMYIYDFIHKVKIMNGTYKPINVEAYCNYRTLYTILGILGDIFSLESVKVNSNHSEVEDSVFIRLSGSIGGIPLTLHVQNLICLDNEVDGMLAHHSIQIFYEHGYWCLPQSYQYAGRFYNLLTNGMDNLLVPESKAGLQPDRSLLGQQEMECSIDVEMSRLAANRIEIEKFMQCQERRAETLDVNLKLSKVFEEMAGCIGRLKVANMKFFWDPITQKFHRSANK